MILEEQGVELPLHGIEGVGRVARRETGLQHNVRLHELGIGHGLAGSKRGARHVSSIQLDNAIYQGQED